ncbi:uncharacterized protein [Penaeus vannamei]|nr:uncharacterized protein LOC113810660 [Penaeus vannamei]
MERYSGKILLALAVLLAAATASSGKDLNTRMTPGERTQVFAKMKERYKRIEPACVPPEHPGENTKPLPTAPDSFTTNVEIAFQEKKMKVIYGAESFDGVLNTGVLRYELSEGIILGRPKDVQKVIHYSIPGDEALFIIANEACEDEGEENCDPKKRCHAGKLEDVSAELRELFGFSDVNGNGGYFGAGGILQWGPQYNYEYRGPSDCRGMRCDRYETCITKPDENATVSITYFWSDKAWNVTSNGAQVPVAIEIYATGKFGHIFQREVMQRYDFYDFYRDVRPDPDELVPPVDVYCRGRKDIYAPPRAPFYFAYNAESIAGFDLPFPAGDNETTTVHFTTVLSHTQYYDWDAKVVRTKYVPWFLFGQENRYEYTTELIQDFQQGLTYEILEHLKVCNIRPTENFTSAGDITVGDDGSVSMVPPWIFADLDEPMQYNGFHWIRGVDADVWVGQKRHQITRLNETYVWYYASPFMLDESENLRAPSQGAARPPMSREPGMGVRMPPLPENFKDNPPEIVSMDSSPLRFEKYLSILAGLPHSIYNIYNYETEPPLTHTLDVSLCYNRATQMRHFIFDLPDDTLSRVNFLRDKLKYASQAALAEAGVVSPLRINRLVLEEHEGSPLRVLFSILEKPDVVGNAPGAILENDMKQAASVIDSFISQSRLVIVVHLPAIALHPEEPVYVAIVPVPGSLKEVDRDGSSNYGYETKQPYQSGDMAGLAIGMLLLGGLLGVAVNMVLQRRASGQMGLPRVNLARRSAPTPETSINLNADLTASET